MKKSNLRKPYLLPLLSVILIFFFSFAPIRTSAEIEKKVYIGGMTAGFQLAINGVQVVGFSDVSSSDGIKSPSKNSELRTGDNIIKADGNEISCIDDLNAALKRSDGAEMKLTVLRDGKEESVCVTPVRDVNGNYKLGILIRDNISGIGTVTYVTKDGLRFGALGHAVADSNSAPLQIADKKVYPCSVIGVVKGVRGKAGELKGLFINENNFATAEKTTANGIYGTFSSEYDFSACELVCAACADEAHMGKAVIYSTVNGIQPKKYEISVVKVDKGNKDNKNFVIKITDKELLESTGGIVRGMSGSPIVQDGKLIGAVTHVFLNDPTRGYGIAVENMLKE